MRCDDGDDQGKIGRTRPRMGSHKMIRRSTFDVRNAFLKNSFYFKQVQHCFELFHVKGFGFISLASVQSWTFLLNLNYCLIKLHLGRFTIQDIRSTMNVFLLRALVV